MKPSKKTRKGAFNYSILLHLYFVHDTKSKTWKNNIRAGWRRLSCHVKKSVTPINLMSGVKKIYLIEDNSKNLFLFLRLKNKKKESAAFVFWFVTYFLSRMFLIARSATPLLPLLV